MKHFLLPLVLLLLGLGGGVGAGLLLAPTPEGDASPGPEEVASAEPLAEAESDQAAQEHADSEGQAATSGHATIGEDGEPTFDYVKLNNQFVVPLLTDGQVDSLVLLSISVEVPAGKEETVLMLEPKLRDTFLQVLFDHANTGGFDGLFTAGAAMRELRDRLLDAAQAAIGDLVTDVLILDLVRQEQR